MARRRARRGAGRRRGVGQPLPSTAALHRLDGCALAVVADYCALPDICALRHRISKRTSQQLASVDDSEVFARARVLQRVAEWWHVTLLPSEQDEDNILGSETRRKNKNYIWHQLRVLLRARHVRTLRLGGLQAFYEYSVQVIRIWHGNDIVRHLVEFPVRPGDLISLGSLEVMRKEVLRRLKEVSTGFPVYYRAYFSSQRFSEFLALDKALRRGTQRPRGCLVGPWRFCEQSLSLDYCPCCKRWRDQCRPEFHFRTTRRGGDPCPSCDLIPWVGALKRYRLTREQLPSSVTWNRKMYRTLAPNDSFFCVSMVLRSRAEEVARQVWGSDWNGRAARAKTRAHKKRRRRQRDAAAKRKSYNKVRGPRRFVRRVFSVAPLAKALRAPVTRAGKLDLRNFMCLRLHASSDEVSGCHRHLTILMYVLMCIASLVVDTTTTHAYTDQSTRLPVG